MQNTSLSRSDVDSQDVFRSCYRGRQSALHHVSYMRMAKVSLTLSLLERAGIDLKGKSVFDYGFGAGTFFRYCPTDSALSGLEIDAQNVVAVKEMLAGRGHREVQLEAVELERWAAHPLLKKTYDVFLCSHVLEHLPDPVGFLRQAGQALNRHGAFVGLVPLNERRPNPHHIHVVDEARISAWARESGYVVDQYLEGDPWVYWAQPLYVWDAGLRHKLAQILSMTLGLPATLLGHRRWSALGSIVGRLTCSKPTQAAFVLTRAEHAEH